MLESEKFRECVGMVLVNKAGQILIGKRIDNKGWQVPQGGVNAEERPEAAALRELNEEANVDPKHCEIITLANEMNYFVPEHLRPETWKDLGYIGQRISFFLMRYSGPNELDIKQQKIPEFSALKWVPFDETTILEIKRLAPEFKKEVYEEGLRGLRNFLDLLLASQSTIFSTN